MTTSIEPVRVYSPPVEMQQAATVLANRLRLVTYPERGWVHRYEEAPPGRLVTSQLIQRRAQTAKGGTATAKPFNRRQREVIEHTAISCGIMFDASGSQGGVQPAVAAARWILTEALDQVHGRVAAVRFGAQARPIQAPGEKLLKVEEYDAHDGWENFADGFPMLEAALPLLDGQGARLLFIVTDGYFNDEHAVEYAERTMDACAISGVAVIWLDAGRGFARPDAYGHGQVISIGDMAPVEVANMLGDAIVDEFRRVAPQHA